MPTLNIPPQRYFSQRELLLGRIPEMRFRHGVPKMVDRITHPRTKAERKLIVRIARKS